MASNQCSGLAVEYGERKIWAATDAKREARRCSSGNLQARGDHRYRAHSHAAVEVRWPDPCVLLSNANESLYCIAEQCKHMLHACEHAQ